MLNNGRLVYDNRVIVVTGAGNGIGKAHALTFTRRGGSVVVNDINREAADSVVAEIHAAGGTAVASYDSVVDGADAIVELAVNTYGKIDVLVNNAGVGVGGENGAGFAVQDMGDQDWQRLMDVHLDGTFRCSRAALRNMRTNNYGRIISTASPVGFFGALNSSHYSAAKIATFGLMQCIALENEGYNIHANTLAPVSASEMSKEYFPQSWLDAAKPNFVSEFAAWLGHESCSINGQAYEVGGGFVHQIRLEMSSGIHLDESDYSAENIASKQQELSDFNDSINPGVGEMHIVVNEIATTLGNDSEAVMDSLGLLKSKTGSLE